MAALLRVDGVSKSFRGLLALHDVSFDVAERGIAALIGPNGAGKTTLFNVIAGVFPPDSGAVHLGDAEITGRRPDEICHAGIGRTFQIVKPFAQMTVLENVTVAALHGAASVAAATATARGFLEMLELDTKAAQHAANLTLPDRKRLEVARALATGPRLLLLDEGDGRPAPVGDRPHGRDAARAARRDRADDSADRACHARRNGALRAHHRAASRREDQRGHAGPDRARSGSAGMLSRGSGPMILSISGLDLFYGDAQALDDVSLDVDAGDIVAVVGSNGAGKSSLIRTIAGIEKPRSGRIVYKDTDITGWPSHRVCNLGIGQVAEGRQIFAGLTVRENLEVGAYLERGRRDSAETMERVFAMFPILKERAEQQAGTLSGGEQQMLAIGRCLLGQPELIMFDEPSLGLAPTIVQEVFGIVERLNADGTPIILVEQNVAVSLRMATRAYVLENGRIVLSGRGEELLQDDRVREAYLGL